MAHDDVDFLPLRALVNEVAPGHALAMAPMSGGASTRRYFRVALPQGKSAVGMYVPEGAKPEEIAKSVRTPSGQPFARWPFIEVRDLLASHNIDVPEILAERCADGWILVEDLGDDTLGNFLLKHPEERAAMYTRAVVELARARTRLEKLPIGSIISSRAYDEDIFRLELEHFREWGLEARGKSLSAADRAAFDAVAARLARRIASWRRGFVHRDFQSRNLMVRAGNGAGPSLAWIDFQDALLGPRVYDLVSLLTDSHQDFDRAFVDARLDDYAREAALGAGERAELGREFDIVTVQRKMKNVGRFVFIDRNHGNSAFLKFMKPTVARMKAALARLGDDDDMKTLGEIVHRALADEG